jgi:hypothetical protein
MQGSGQEESLSIPSALGGEEWVLGGRVPPQVEWGSGRLDWVDRATK